MKNIKVIPIEKGKYKVLVNYIQHGINFSCKPLAEKHAEELRKQYHERTI